MKWTREYISGTSPQNGRGEIDVHLRERIFQEEEGLGGRAQKSNYLWWLDARWLLDSLSPGINPNREKAQNSMTHRLIDTLLFLLLLFFSAIILYFLRARVKCVRTRIIIFLFALTSSTKVSRQNNFFSFNISDFLTRKSRARLTGVYMLSV